jgi:hypothetical protein
MTQQATIISMVVIMIKLPDGTSKEKISLDDFCH